MAYTPPAEILEKYAQVLINFALGGGTGIKPGEAVMIQLPECAKPLYVPLRDTVLKAGGHPFMFFSADDVQPGNVYSLASDEQLIYFAASFYKGIVEQFDHRVAIIAESDKYELKDVDPKKLMLRSNSAKQYREWMNEKEAAGKYTWTLAMYGTPAMSADANMSEEEYWAEIIRACYLDDADPIAAWKKTSAEVGRIKDALNSLQIEKVHVEAEGIDLWVGLGKDRAWLGGGGRNIPSFEIFISPDCRSTEGTVAFNQPLYRYGNVIEGIVLRFEGGRVMESTATRNQDLLREMIASENADRIGEFSLTDGRHSRITRTMGETLFDENIGGPEGNTHLALGNAYQDSYVGDQSAVTKQQWEEMGYNSSPVHTDIVSTARRTVTATLPDGSQKVVYQNGQFLV